MQKQKLIAIIVVGAAVAAGAYIYYMYGNFVVRETPQAAENQGLPTAESNPSVLTDAETYSNDFFGFSFRYPKDFNSSELEDESGATVLLQKEGAREGFQIYITEFDEEGPITPERIKQDLPDTVVSDPQQVLIGEKKDIPALIFLSKHESLGDVREVWFSANGYLYQLTAYADMDNFIGPILETLRFEN